MNERYDEDAERIPVVMIYEDDWRSARGIILKTEEVSSCTVVSVYNAQTNQGYMGHFLFQDQTKFQELQEKISRDSAQPENLKVWVGGGSPPSPTYEHQAIDEHSTYIDKLINLGIKEVNIEQAWLEFGFAFSAVTLDCDSGITTVQIKTV